MFRTTGGPTNEQNTMYHLAHMVAMLGPPPREFLARTQGHQVKSFFDENGE